MNFKQIIPRISRILGQILQFSGLWGTRGFEIRVRVSPGLVISCFFVFGSNRVQEKRPKPVGFSGSGKPDHALLNLMMI